MRQGSQLVAWAGVWLLLGRAALGDGIILNGVSARTIGRGGANIGHFDNAAVLYDNPAAMSQLPTETTFELGATLLLTDFRYADAQNDATAQHTLYGLPEFSIVRSPYDSSWSFGLGAFAPAGFGAIYNLEGPAPFSGTRQYKSFGTLAKLLPGVSYRVNDRLSIGGTLGLGITVADLEGPYTLQGPTLPGTPTLMNLDVDGAALCWSVGMMYQLTESTTVGLAYQSESRFEAEGTTHVTTPFGESTYDTQLDITWPRSVGLGVRHELCPHRILSTDIIWFDWSSAFDDFGLHLNSPSNGLFPEAYEQFPLDWRDTVSIRVGYEQLLACDQTMRFGYVYHRVPIPNDTITPFIPAALEHAFSLGYGWMWRGWNVDAAYMYTFGPTVTVETSDFLGGDFDDARHRAETHAIGLGLMRQY
ncbi:MAG: outer membrane protein transport protein [Pirellulales bacterium]